MVDITDWEQVSSRVKYIIKEIDPIKLLPVLELAGILGEQDGQCISAVCTAKGPIHATQNELLVRLKKRGPTAFPNFVAALRETGQSHAAQLLDPTFKVTATISDGRRDDRVLEAGVAADIRIKISFSNPTEGQIKEVKGFCERFKISHCEDAVKLRQHFNDFLDENIRQYVNLVKTTFSDETPLIFIFRLSDLGAANSFWKDFNEGDLKSTIRTKLQSFPEENNCFKNKDIQFDIFIDEDDFQKVHHTLENPKECKVLVDSMEKQELKLRDYQVELVKPALEGKNTIICAPTGSGKTFVAIGAIKHHMTCPDRKCVAFIVNTVSLVEQQQAYLERYLPESVDVSSICGNNPDISLLSVLENAHVVVLTAQVLLNSLKKDKQGTEQAAAVEKEISISKFSLLVFDECHHTTKEHPYNEIMKWYMKEKFEVSSSNLPHIIGLSASLGIGTGNSGSGEKAEQNIMGICASLDVHELQVHAEKQDTRVKIAPISRDHVNVFQKTISDTMTDIETMMSSVRIPAIPHGSQPYENWVVNLCNENLGRDILTCSEHLKFYNSSLMINDQIRSEDALQYLQKKIHSKESTEMEIKLREVFDKAVAAIQDGDSEPNPGLQILEEHLFEKLSCAAKNGLESKGIIFVRTRFVAETLVDWLKNSQALQNLVKHPTSVIGCGHRDGKAGMPKARQDREIDKFRNGDCNVIVATSVLLEGIDIKKCNFAIDFGMPGNEITLMQARGRVRANGPRDDWQYVIIVPREQAMMKERDLLKEKLMKETVAKVKRKSKEDFEKQIEHLQKEAYNEYLEKNLAKQSSSQASPVPDDIDFHCKKCETFACKAKHIKLFSNTCRIVPKYKTNLHNVIFKEASSKSLPGGFCKTGKVHCESCDQDWGVRAKNKFGEFPMLKIFSFRVKRNSEELVYKQWKEFPYKLETFDTVNDVDLQH